MMHHETPARAAFLPIDVEADLRERRRLRVFLAEDDPDLRRLLAMVLRADGYEVVESSDGSDLLDRLASTLLDDGPIGPLDVDVIVADVCMPGCRGIDVLAGLRQASWRTPVILMTGYPDAKLRARARRLGATAFLSKPIDLDGLRATVESVAPPC